MLMLDENEIKGKPLTFVFFVSGCHFLANFLYALVKSLCKRKAVKDHKVLHHMLVNMLHERQVRKIIGVRQA